MRYWNIRSNKQLGWKDSNLRMAVPKTAALPLGDTPSLEAVCVVQRQYRNDRALFLQAESKIRCKNFVIKDEACDKISEFFSAWKSLFLYVEF